MSDMFVIYPKLAKKLFDQLQIFINTKFIILFNSKVLWYMENCPTGKLASVTCPGKLPPTLTLSQTFTLILIQGGICWGAVSRRTILRSRSTLRMPPKNKIFMFNFPSLILK